MRVSSPRVSSPAFDRVTPKLIVFDKDGTLGDATSGLQKYVNQVLSLMLSTHFSPTLSPTEITTIQTSFHASVGWDHTNQRASNSHSIIAASSWNHIIESAVLGFLPFSASSEDELLVILTNIHISIGPIHGRDSPLSKNTPLLLSSLKSYGLKIGICTMDSRESTTLALEYWGVCMQIDTVLTSCDMKEGFKKPNPQPLLDICAMFGVSPAETIVVGDTSNDICMAVSAKAGLTVGVLSGSGTHEGLMECGADFVIKDVNWLIDLLEKYYSLESSSQRETEGFQFFMEGEVETTENGDDKGKDDGVMSMSKKNLVTVTDFDLEDDNDDEGDDDVEAEEKKKERKFAKIRGKMTKMTKVAS